MNKIKTVLFIRIRFKITAELYGTLINNTVDLIQKQ